MSAFGGLHCVENFGVGGVEFAHADVVANGAIEEENVLADETDLGAKAGDGGVAQVDAIEKDGAFGGVVETENQLQRVVLPLPLAPTMTTNWPLGISRVRSRRIG